MLAHVSWVYPALDLSSLGAGLWVTSAPSARPAPPYHTRCGPRLCLVMRVPLLRCRVSCCCHACLRCPSGQLVRAPSPRRDRASLPPRRYMGTRRLL